MGVEVIDLLLSGTPVLHYTAKAFSGLLCEYFLCGRISLPKNCDTFFIIRKMILFETI